MENTIFKQFRFQMVKETIFKLIHELQKSRSNQSYFPSIMYLSNLAIHIAFYLSIPSLSILSISSTISSTPLLYALGSFTLFLIAQLIIYFLREIQAHLTYQLSLYRFIVSPLLAYSILQAGKNGNLPQAIALITFVINKMLSSLLSRTVLYEFYRNYTLKIMETSIVFQLDTFQILLISNCFIIDNTQFIFIGLTLVRSLLTTYKHFLHIESNSIQYKILFIANVTHTFLSIFCLQKIIFFGVHAGYTFIAVSLLIVASAFIIRKKQKTIHNNISQLLSNQLPFLQFLQAVDCFLMLTKYDPSADRKRKHINYVYAIMLHHQAKCEMPNCELENPSVSFNVSQTQEQLKQITSKGLLQLTHKILKKIQWIFEEYHSKSSDDIMISFAFLKFYSQYLQNKTKMQNLINEIRHQDLTLTFELELFKYAQVCTHIQNLDSIDVIKDEEIYVEFQKAMIATLNYMIEFWGQFSEEKVDLGKIMSISAKLFPFKARIEEIFFEQLKIQKFTTFKILKLYIQYLRRILNKIQMALKIEDFMLVLSNLLKDKQDIQYRKIYNNTVSKESQSGFVVICLSESKLGDIFMVNEKACDIFRYSKKQMLSLRVNAIMPSVIADVHDQILMDFLKKKRKKYNTDQRMLFGKDGNGYIFPIELQLQRASFSSNDEYIFIASVSPYKLRSAPVYCIVDHDGEITDFTASFRNLFYKKVPRDASKNIQQIIPAYFDTDYIDKATTIRSLTQYISNPKLGEIEAKFEIIPLIIKTWHEGYLVKMSYNNQKTTSIYRNLNFTDNMQQLLTKNQVKCMENAYNHLVDCYQFTKTPCNISLRFSGTQFTLPFLSYQDMAIFANSNEIKRYDINIKTIRLINNHFERIDQEQSFHSQSFTNDDKLDVRAKIEELKHKFSKKQDQSIIIVFKIWINIIIVIAIIVSGTIYTNYLREVEEEKEFLSQFDIQKQIFYYLPQYIISFTLAKASINTQYFTRHLDALKPILINNIMQSKIDQIYKQQIMRIVYLQSPYQLSNILHSQTFAIPDNDSSIASNFQTMWAIMVGISVLFFLTFILMYYYFHQILFSIYTLFLSLKQSSIKKIEESCRALINKIYFESQENIQKEEQKRNIEEDEDQNQIQKIKQFKNTSRQQDLINLIKLTIPLILISGFVITMLFLSNYQFKMYDTMKNKHNIMFQIIPSSSIEITKIFLKAANSITIVPDNNYDTYYQQLEMVILQFNQNAKDSSYLDVLYGNICTNSPIIRPDIAPVITYTCETLGNGILKSGISSTINFVSEELKNISISNKLDAQTALLIFSLQFQFVNPAMLEIQDSMEEILISKIQGFGSFFSSMVILLTCFYIIYDVYLILYPLHTIETQIRLTNEMISLMPDNAGQESQIQPSADL